MPQLRIHLLLDDPWMRLAVEYALRPALQAGRGLELRSGESWSDVVSQGDIGWSIFVVDPAAARGDTERWTVLGRLVEQYGAERLVLYVTSQDRESPDLAWLRHAGTSISLVRRMDEDPGSILTALAVAAVGALVADVASPVARQLGPRAEALMRSIFTRKYRGWTVLEAAAAIHESPRTLRRECGRLGLPPPERLLGWGRLLRAAVLSRLGVSSAFGLAPLVGYHDARSLQRLGLRYLGRSMSEILAESREGEVALLDALRDELIG